MSGAAVKLEPERPLILIVDDEEGIRKTLQGVFRDEGFATIAVADGVAALKALESVRPDLVLLDIWMPEMDGIETLKRILAERPDLPVIMVSGHATIATAVTATQLGARDFIEKPLDLNATVNSAKRALGLLCDTLRDGPRDAEPPLGTTLEEPAQAANVALRRVVFENQSMRGARVTQRTLAGSAVLYGQGLHSGKKSGLALEPLPAGSGIHFVGVSGRSAVPAHLDFVESTGWATTIRLGLTQAGTIEHLLSALLAYGVSNLLVKCNGEVPVMDGSAREFCTLIEATGVEEQEGEWYEIAISKTIRVGKEREFLQVEPADRFIVDYTLEYPDPVGRQNFVFELASPQSYLREIAPARTFGMARDIGMLQKQGLALGGRFDNFVLMGADGPVNTELRFADELVRHKILDVIGDLYLLGRPIRGKVTARMTGHSDNIALLRAIKAEMLGLGI